MSEFARLLHDAAGAPPRLLVMEAVRRRAARRSLRRRLAVGLAGLGLATGIGVPAGVSLLTTGDRPAGLEAGIDQDRPQPPPSKGLVDSHPTGTVRSASPPPAPSHTPTSAPSTDDDPTSDDDAQPVITRASSCSVDNLWLRAGESKRCRFIATAAGGWNVHQERGSTSPLESETVTAVVYVTRDDVTAEYRTREIETDNGSRTQGCADDIIQPGDLVEIVLSETEDDTPLDLSSDEGVAAGAGQGWGCTNPGRPWWATDDNGSS